MRIIYVHGCPTATPAGQPDEYAAISGPRVLHDTSAGRAGREFLLAILAEGDDLLVPSLRHLGDTADAALASLRRAVDAGARVTLLRDGLDGATILKVAAHLEALSGAGGASRSLPSYRAYGRATPERVTEIVALSAAGTPIRTIAATVGLSVATVVRIRQAHRASLRSLRSAVGLTECQGSVH